MADPVKPETKKDDGFLSWISHLLSSDDKSKAEQPIKSDTPTFRQEVKAAKAALSKQDMLDLGGGDNIGGSLSVRDARDPGANQR